MRQISILAFLSVGLLTTSFQCNKDLPAAIKPTYEYAEKLTLTPYRKTYVIGDTIWVQFQTAEKSLFDKLSGNRIPTDTTSLRVNFTFRRNYPNPGTVELFIDSKVDSVLDVSFAPLYTYYNVLDFKTACSSSHYFFKVAVVPKHTGIYSIGAQVYLLPCPNKSPLPYSTLNFTFDLADCNKNVWLSIPPQSRGGELGETDVAIDKKEIFVFKVE
jgi:hypothetical protein